MFERARNESSHFKENWQTVNINEFVKKFTPGAKGIISKDGRKIIYKNKHNSLQIVTDVAGGYCRLQDTSKRGKESFLYINDKGKKQGRTKSQFNEATHFGILKRKEM